LPRFPELEETLKVDVVVVGGGFMGLATALALAENGVSVLLFEAAQIGWGASGRNNGLVVPGLKRDPDEVRAILGADPGDRLLRYSGSAPATVFELIEKHGIDCDANRGGWIQAAHSRRALPLIEKRVSQWQELGATAELIPADEVAQRLGSDYYAGAWIDPCGGSINPLAYVGGLAAAAQKAGVHIHERSPVCHVGKGPGPGKWTVQATHMGAVHCDHVVYCTNAYSRSIPALIGTVVPLRTAQVASVPLEKEQVDRILPGGESASDTQRLLTSFRTTADGRLIMGGASATAGDESPALFEHLHRAARARFPDLGAIPWEFGWSGYLALTHDHLPHILKLKDGIYAGVGCNGRGIAMATVTGMSIAALICGQDQKDCNVPIRNPKRIMGYEMRHVGVAAAVMFNRFLDRAERRLIS
jgi:glycine/D-amino acid oxidase-like deaminating enzyme